MIIYDELIPNMCGKCNTSWVLDPRQLVKIKGKTIITNKALADYIRDMKFQKFMLARVRKSDSLLMVFRDDKKAAATSRTFTANGKDGIQYKCCTKENLDSMMWGLYELEFNCLQDNESIHNLVLVEAIKNIKKK